MASMPSLRDRVFSAYGLLILPQFLWATNAIVGKIAAQHGIPPVALAFWRWVLAFAFLLPFAWSALVADRAKLRAHWPMVLVLGALSAGAYNALMYAALATSTAINVTLVASAMPVVMALLARVWLGERLNGRQGLGIAISALGVVVVVARGDITVLLSLALNRGDLLMLLAMASWSVYSVLLRRHPLGLKPISLLAGQIGAGVLVLVPIYAWERAGGAVLPLDLTTAWVLPYTAIFPAIFAFYFWNRGVAAVGPSIAGVYTNLMPILTALLAVWLLGEEFAWYHMAGLALILGGIAFVTGLPRRRAGA
ncbi:EamA family transporter [Rhodospirillum rubrum]|uniref:DMT family transporter n=1 Tax=Rhodospirillum rubrum TaxID=1085 RepID=UPI001907609A|nr:DMT family transporter [Rhodospirillum rubrum]MBK1663843.1 EamA family transporter [Rhodospirillum rubrum]MBK1677920.1 EamA family transporter [Rhodospirillum rubrum]